MLYGQFSSFLIQIFVFGVNASRTMKANGKTPITRNLTSVFLRHRERRAVHRRFGPSHGDVDRLLDVESGPKTMEMTHLPPQWIEAAESAREDIKLIKESCSIWRKRNPSVCYEFFLRRKLRTERWNVSLQKFHPWWSVASLLFIRWKPEVLHPLLPQIGSWDTTCKEIWPHNCSNFLNSSASRRRIT